MPKDTTKPKFTKKPLAEALFELRWELKVLDNGALIDPYYKLFVGSFFDKIKVDFKVPEPLPASSMPDEISAYIVQHRFRTTEGGYPLMQIGPGILSYNDTKNYEWDNFEKGIGVALNAFYDSYPDTKFLKIKQAQLRFINLLPFDSEANNVLEFLKNKMKIKLELPSNLFENENIEKSPKNINLIFTFHSTNPNCDITFRLGTGVAEGKKVFIWEIIVTNEDSSGLDNEKSIFKWVSSVHNLIEDWFYKIIDGELIKDFE